MKKTLHRVSRYSELALALALVALGAWLLMHPPAKIGPGELDPSSWATLVGAIVGAAAILVGNSINRFAQRVTARDEQHVRATKLRALITAELVNVAVGHIQAKRALIAAHTSATAQGYVQSPTDLSAWYPRQMPLTDASGAALIDLEPGEIESLATVKANLAQTRSAMEEVSSGRSGFGLLRITVISDAISHDLRCLAEAFRRIAPTRQLQIPEEEPALASELLDHFAAEQPAGGPPAP